MTKTVDISSKRLAGVDATGLVRWLTGDQEAQAGEPLTNELQFIGRATDVLIKVKSAQYGEYLVANEIQFWHDPRMPLRMRAYAALVEERFGLPVYSVVINVKEPDNPDRIAHEYRRTFLGQESVHQYHVVNLWEVDAATAAKGDLPFLLPFVPVLRGGNDIDIIKQALYAIRSDPNLMDFENFLAFMARFVLDEELVCSLMRWDMAILRENPWYNEILQEGYEKGVEKGVAQGIEQGMEIGLVAAVTSALEARFGKPDPALLSQLRCMAPDDLLDLIKVILNAASPLVVADYVRAHSR